MRRKSNLLIEVGIALILLMLTACGGGAPTATPTAPSTPTPIPSPTPSPTPSPVVFVQEGDELLKRSDFDAAWESYDKAISIDGDHALAYAGQSLVYLWQGIQIDEALVLAETAAELMPDNAKIQAVLTLAYIRNNKYAEAVEAAEYAVELDSADSFAQAMLALAYLEDNQFENANQAALDAYALDPKSATSLYALGQYYERTADFARARESYQRAAQIEPDFVGWQTELGRFWSWSEQFEKAIAVFDHALEIAPGHIPTILARAYVDIDRKDFTSAQAQLEEALELAPDKPGVYISLGYLNLEQENYDEALKQFNKALELNPDSYTASYAIGEVYLWQDECEQAELQFQELASTYPNWSAPLVSRGYAELCAGNVDKALPHFREAANLNPYNSFAHGSIGLGYTHQGRWDDARDAYLEALRLDLSPSNLHNSIGDYFWDQSLYEEAEAEYQHSVVLNPYSSDGYYNLAWSFLVMERTDEGGEAMEKAVAIDPTDQDLFRSLGYIYLLQGEAQKAVEVLEGVLEDDPEDAWSHLNMGLAKRDLGDYPTAMKEIETYIALAGDYLGEEELNRLNFLIEVLEQEYILSEEEALKDMATIFEFFFETPIPAEIEELEDGRTLVITLPLTAADLEDDNYLFKLGALVGLESLFVPRIDPPVENGLQVRFTRGGVELFSAHISNEALKQYADTIINEEELIASVEFNLPEDTVRNIAIQQICRDVAGVRELEISQTSPYQTLTQDELQDNIESNLDEEIQTTLDRDAKVLSMLGLISPTLNLNDVWVDLYTEQIAGYYDTEDETIYLVDLDEPSASDQLVLTHECVHTLQDQSFDLEGLDDPEFNDDQQLALEALIEGDATLATILYMEEFIPTLDQLEAASQASGFETESLETAPDIISGAATFPYDAGFEFVLSLYERNEWESVDDAFNELPQSTEQILHSERYFNGDQPIEVQIPDLAGKLDPSWQEYESEVFGEFGLQMILRDYIGPLAAMEAAKGWGGDRYLLLHDDDQDSDILILKTTWDDQDESDQFWNLFRAAMYHRAGYTEIIEDLTGELTTRIWQSETDTVLGHQKDKDVIILFGADRDILETILTGLIP